jgi:antitoxin ChpS
MLTATLRNVDGSVVIMAISEAVVEGLGLAANTRAILSIDRDRFVIQVQHKPRYTLAELLDQCDPSAPEPEEDRSWQNLDPVGREIW